MKSDGRLGTADALQFANLDRMAWNNAVQRGLYPGAPKTVVGRARLFGVDDLIAAYVLGQLFERQVLPAFACQIACDVLDHLGKTPAVKTLSAWKCAQWWDANAPPAVVVAERAPQPEAIELFRFDVAKIRREALAGIRRKAAEQGA